MKRVIFLLLIFFVTTIFCGCKTENIPTTNATSDVSNAQSDQKTESSNENSEIVLPNIDEMFTNRDQRDEYDADNSVIITLNGNTATSSSDTVVITDGVITITESETYIFEGNLDNGMIIVDADDDAKIQIVFNGINITSPTSAALYVANADKLFVTLAPDSVNTLSNGGSFVAIDDNNIDSTIFSKSDLTFNGTGSLSVVSPAGHGIVSKDDLVIVGGSYSVNCSSHGFDVNDSVRITGDPSITINSGKDGVHCENSDNSDLGFVYISNGTFDIKSEGDGISAGSYFFVEDGVFNMYVGGGNENGEEHSNNNHGGFMGGDRNDNQNSSANSNAVSMKGIKSSGNIIISGGTFNIDSAEDCVHSDTSIKIENGEFVLLSGDDGVHAEESLIITHCSLVIETCYEGLEALNIKIHGGDIKICAEDDGINPAGESTSETDDINTGIMYGDERRGGTGGPGGPGGPGGMGGMGGTNSNGTLLISGGNIYVKASGDGIDVNGSLEITGGYIVVVGASQGDTSILDYDTTAIISGGTFIGTGARGMAQTFSSDSPQGVYAVSIGTQNAGTEITLRDKNNNVVISHSPDLSFSAVILSSPDIISGEKYKITIGSASGEYEAS